VDDLLRRPCLDDARWILSVTTVTYQTTVKAALAGLRCARKGEQSWIVGTTEVVLWLPLDFSLSKAADSTATGAGVLVPSLPQDASADRAGPPSGAGNSKAEPLVLGGRT
jgi:hypothetical protein